MAKHSTTDTFEDQKEKLQEIINKLAAQFDLDEDDVTTAKEWGIALLVAGVSIYIVYQLLQRLFGSDDEVVVEEEYDDDDDDDSDLGDRFSAIADLLKGQLGVFLVAIARQQIMSFLRKNNLMDDDD